MEKCFLFIFNSTYKRFDVCEFVCCTYTSYTPSFLLSVFKLYKGFAQHSVRILCSGILHSILSSFTFTFDAKVRMPLWNWRDAWEIGEFCVFLFLKPISSEESDLFSVSFTLLLRLLKRAGTKMRGMLLMKQKCFEFRCWMLYSLFQAFYSHRRRFSSFLNCIRKYQKFIEAEKSNKHIGYSETYFSSFSLWLVLSSGQWFEPMAIISKWYTNSKHSGLINKYDVIFLYTLHRTIVVG